MSLLVRRSVLLFFLAATFSFGCDQRPIDVVPYNIKGSWQVLPLKRQRELDEIAGVSGTEIYASQVGSGLLIYDGNNWAELEGTPFDHTVDIFASPSLGIYVLTSDRVFRRDGDSWTEIYYHEEGWMRQIWVSSPTDIHVGASNGMVHFDGMDWSILQGTEEFDAFDLWGSSPADVFAVGGRGLIAHYDGAEWTVMQHNLPYWFNSVWGSGPSDVYATTLFRVMRFDGSAWSAVELLSEVDWISDVWGTSADNVFILHSDLQYDVGGIIRFNGSEWETMVSNTACELNAIWGSDIDNIYAVGKYGKIVHFNGVEWQSVTGGAPEYPQFITGLDDQNIYVGNEKSIFHFDGLDFNELPNSTDGLETIDLWARSQDELISVGRNGKVFRFDGIRWNRMVVPVDQDLMAVSGIDDGSMIVVGENNTILMWNGTEWSLLDPVSDGGGITWRDAWMVAHDEFFIVGDGGFARKYHDNEWYYYKVDTSVLLSVWGVSSHEVLISGQEAIYRFNGAGWDRMQYPEYFEYYFYEEDLHCLVGTGMTNIFVSDDHGALYHFDGNIWSPVMYDDMWLISAIWLSPGNRLYCPERYGEYIYKFSE